MEFPSISSKSSMKRKQSNSILAALGKQSQSRQSAIAIPFNPNPPPSAYSYSPSTATTPHFPPSSATTPSTDDGYSVDSPYAESSRNGHGGHGYSAGGRSVSGASAGSTYASSIVKGGERSGTTIVRRPEDVFRLVKDRLFCWSYLIQWYQGDTPWLNSVKVSRSAVEAQLGMKSLDTRARSFFVLGASLASLLDISSVDQYLRGIIKLLDEWESWNEGGGGKGVKNLFKQRSKRPSGSGEYTDSSESLIVNVTLPFQPDFFQVHASTCSIIRDIYKKLLGMVLPTRNSRPSLPQTVSNSDIHPSSSLFHPATLISSAPLETAFADPRSPSSLSTHSHDDYTGTAGLEHGVQVVVGQYDAFQALILGELPADRTLVGEGQKLSPQVVDLLAKADSKLKKHFSVLLREGDSIARKVLEDEVAALTASMVSGPPIRFGDSGQRVFGTV